MIIKSYEQVFFEINKIYSQKKKINFMITGGNSIKGFYKYLSNKIDQNFIKKTNFYLSDERIFVNKKDTNFFLVKSNLLNKYNFKNINLFKFYDSQKNIDENLNFFEKKLKIMDIIFLSYGKDGHVASLFPNLKTMISKKNVCFVYNKNNKFKFRISITEDFINKSKNKFLFFLGEEKKKIFLREKKKIFTNKLFKNFKIVLS